MPILDPDDYLSYIVYDEVRGGWCLTEESQWLLIQEMIARTRELDRLDVIEGQKPPTYKHLIQPEMARKAVTYLFLDTEWADQAGSELVSLALITEDGIHRLYAERDRLPEVATDFVRSAVYPLLERGSWRMTDQAMTTGVRAFLGAVTEPIVVADYPNDLALLQHVIAGFDPPDDQAAACGPVPKPVMTRMLKEGATGMLVEDYFAGHPQAAARRHNALVDAEALRMAWLVVTGRVAPPPWAFDLP